MASYIDVDWADGCWVVVKTYESHPEVCFDVLTDGLEHSKDTEAGRTERLEENDDLHSLIDGEISEPEETEWHHRISRTRLDDVLDAAVLAFTAKRHELTTRREHEEYPALPSKEIGEKDDILEITPEIVLPVTP